MSLILSHYPFGERIRAVFLRLLYLRGTFLQFQQLVQVWNDYSTLLAIFAIIAAVV